MRRVLLASGLVFAVAAVANDSPRRIHRFGDLAVGELLEEEIVLGCGCSFQHSSASAAELGPLIQWELGENASMHMDGRLETLQITGTCLWHGQLGKEESCHLTGANVTADIAAKATWVCPADSESCEVTKYDGTMSIAKGTKRASIAVRGECGC